MEKCQNNCRVNNSDQKRHPRCISALPRHSRKTQADLGVASGGGGRDGWRGGRRSLGGDGRFRCGDAVTGAHGNENLSNGAPRGVRFAVHR